MKKILRYTFVIALGAIISTTTAFAQQQQQQQQQMPQQPQPLSPEEISDEDLQMVSTIASQAEDIQAEADEKVKAVIEDEGIEFSRFQQIVMAQQNPQMSGEVDISEEEQATLEKVQPDLMEINQQAQQQYMETIEEEGLSVERFQRIAQAIQAHPEVAERFEEINGDGSNG